jgi:hypothetical protein
MGHRALNEFLGQWSGTYFFTRGLWIIVFLQVHYF